MRIVIAILILEIVIWLHELGHFIIAKASGIRVLEFALGMGPKLVSFEKKGTVYSWRAIPIGGFCSMQGEDEDNKEVGSFNAAPAGKRFATVAAGPVFNFIFAFVFAAVLIAAAGADPARITLVDPEAPAYAAGLREGDIVKYYEGNSIVNGRDLNVILAMDGIPEDEMNLTVLRGEETVNLCFEPDEYTRYMLGYQYTQDNPAAVIEGIVEGLPMEAAGFRAGDIITAVDGTFVESAEDLSVYWDEHPMDGTPIQISFIRNGSSYETTVTPQMHTDLYAGFDFNIAREKQGFFSGIKYAFGEMKYWFSATVKSLAGLIKGRFSVRELSGPVGIVSSMSQIIEESARSGIGSTAVTIVEFIIMLSVNLGIMNLLPLPALDGGRLVFIVIEAVRRKPVDRRIEGIVHFVGMIVIFGIAILIALKDVMALF